MVNNFLTHFFPFTAAPTTPLPTKHLSAKQEVLKYANILVNWAEFIIASPRDKSSHVKEVKSIIRSLNIHIPSLKSREESNDPSVTEVVELNHLKESLAHIAFELVGAQFLAKYTKDPIPIAQKHVDKHPELRPLIAELEFYFKQIELHKADWRIMGQFAPNLVDLIQHVEAIIHSNPKHN